MTPHDQLQRAVEYLMNKQRVLLITTSNRWEGAKDVAKSTQLAQQIQQELGTKKCTLLDATKMHIHQCEGNISGEKNTCGVKDAKLKDTKKNPSGHHRCWASINHTDDDLWKISKELLECDVVVFVGSVRWGTMNAVHQTLMERLSWLENRHSTLGESNILKGKEAGVICTGQNWRGKEVVDTQQKVLEFYGFKTPDVLSWNWQYTKDASDETQASYRQASKLFPEIFKLTQNIRESFQKFFRTLNNHMKTRDDVLLEQAYQRILESHMGPVREESPEGTAIQHAMMEGPEARERAKAGVVGKLVTIYKRERAQSFANKEQMTTAEVKGGKRLHSTSEVVGSTPVASGEVMDVLWQDMRTNQDVRLVLNTDRGEQTVPFTIRNFLVIH